MRRIALLGIFLVLGAGALVALMLSGSGSATGAGTSRFDVIFDDARGLIGGQLVKIAGAKAGVIENVVVTRDFKAKIEATVDSRFMPFHADATCTIRPEGLIAENYVDCDPGTMGAPVLRGRRGDPPTVPVSQTTEPVALTDLFNIFNLPTRERFTALINELGIGTAGRGDDFNEILRRANPTLAEARRVIGILNAQQVQLAGAIDASSRLIAEGAAHPQAVQAFLDRAAALTTLTAGHRGALAQTVARLPGLLAAAQPSLAELDTVARQGTPLVAQLHRAVPALNRVAADLGPFAAAAQPGLTALRGALRIATPAVRHITPLVRTVNAYARRALPGTRLFARLASNLQRHGFLENFLSVVYYIQASLSREDATSHMLAILLVGAQNGTCGNYSTTPVPGCSAHFGQQPAYKPQNASPDAPIASPGASQRGASGPRTSAARKTGASRRRAAAALGPAPSSNPSLVPPLIPGLTGAGNGVRLPDPLRNLTTYLLGR
jgi:ABC-type transporter Mla subunit MlaD